MEKYIAPIVKWAGGKRQLLPELRKRVPKKYSLYVEPFLGGGALFFALKPKRARVNDLNAELMNLYTVVRDELPELIGELRKHKNEKDYFYEHASGGL